ncbi:MAG: hypothetical protein LBP19_01050 [Treponema sp.]|jgi:hypothetical protein|nr:hypothetical protein [Treponema sp.]
MIAKIEEGLKVNKLEKYISLFNTNNLIDVNAIANLEESDLENLGIMAMGDRKKLIKLFSMYREEAKKNAEIIRRKKIKKSVLIGSIITVVVVALGISGYFFVYPIVLYKQGVKYAGDSDYNNAIVSYSKALEINNVFDMAMTPVCYLIEVLHI